MQHKALKKLVIAGGGTAGWMAAAAASKLLGSELEVTIIESDEIPTVGVGEATIPPLQVFHRLIGLDEQDFMRETQATFKLGIRFDDWGALGDSYIHSFGTTGKDCWAGEFQHFWLRGKEKGIAGEFGDYCLELQAAKADKFAKIKELSLNYAYHFDASLYAQFLRRHSEALGARRVEGKIVSVTQNPQTGFIESLKLANGQVIEGDMFVDCTGFRGLLIENALHTGYEDWSHWLPCDSAVAVQTASISSAVPYTYSTAREEGWQWRIPLQSRVGNGLVYCSRYISDEEAISKLSSSVQGEQLTQPRVIKFKTGRRRKGWNKNCVALGLASGFIEPLESTSIHLVMSGILRLLKLFPYNGVTDALVDEYNVQTNDELERIRDFVVLHYRATQRDDSDFWRFCRSMEIPDSLQHRLDLFVSSARVFKEDSDLFRVDSWTQVMLGQRLMPMQYHPVARTLTDDELVRFLRGQEAAIKKAVERLPSHQSFIESYCKAPTSGSSL